MRNERSMMCLHQFGLQAVFGAAIAPEKLFRHQWRQAQFKKQLAKRLLAPHVPSAKLHGDLQNTYKIKLRDVGYRLVYDVIDLRLVIVVIAVGRRDHDEVYVLVALAKLNAPSPMFGA